MADDSEFLSRLISFGLSEKEAQAYFHLLKYGPKPPTLLAKSLKTYREDIYRTLNGLVDKGMVNPSLRSSTVYPAVELETALDVALKKYESECREIELKKRELQEMSELQQFRPSDEFSTFKIVKSLKEHVAVLLSLINSTEREVMFVATEIVFAVSSLYWIKDIKKFVDRGEKIRLITDFSYKYIESVQQHLDIGVDVRQLTGYQGILFAVYDRKTSQSVINADIRRVSLNEPLSILWTDDPIYANYLASTFELFMGAGNSCSTADRGAVERGVAGRLRMCRKCY